MGRTFRSPRKRPWIRIDRTHLQKSCLVKMENPPPVYRRSESRIRAAAAVEIQKAFRAFLAKKSGKEIIGIKVQVDEIEMKLLRMVMFDLVKKDSKEVLKLNEMLMKFLCRLDSIRGVRELRKAVISKVILLQERLDGIVSKTGQTLEMDDGETSSGKDRVYDEMLHQKSMERLVEENNKLMRSVEELCEREAMQAKLINSLLRRIECLEDLYEREELQAKSISSLEQRVESLVLRDEVRKNAEKRLWEAVYENPTANGF